MASEVWDEVDSYFGGNLLEHDKSLDDTIESQKSSGMPAINVSPLQGRLLNLFVKMTGSKKVLEIGTLGGYSSIWMGKALPADGKLFSLEINDKHASIAEKNIKSAGLSDKVTVILGHASDTLDELIKTQGRTFDLVFIDADKDNIPVYYEKSMKLTHSGSIIAVDNVVRKGKVADDKSDDVSVQGIRKLVSMLKDDKRVEATAIQTVGIKDYDGFMVIRVR